MSESATQASTRYLLRRFWGYAKADARWFWFGLAMVPLTSFAGLAQPWLIKEAIDGPLTAMVEGQKATSSWSLSFITQLFLAVTLVQFLTRGAQLYALNRLGFHALHRLRRHLYSHVMSQRLGFFDKRARGSLLSRSTNDVEAIGEVLMFGIVGLVGDVVHIVGIIGAMLWLNLELTVVSLVGAPLIVLTINHFRKRFRTLSVEIRRANAVATGYFSEALSGHRVVQLHGREAQTVREYKGLNYKFLSGYHRANWYDASLYAIMDGVSGLCIALLIAYGARMYFEQSVTIGLLVAFVQYIQRLFVPVRDLSGRVSTIERAMASLGRIFDLLDVDEAVPSGDQRPPSAGGTLRVEALSFRYNDDAPLALADVNLEVAAGEVVALVGATGSGKSTLGKLLNRMYIAPAETIFVDEVAIERWDLEALRQTVGVVQQDVVIFTGSVRDNVTLGADHLDDEAILSALKRARLWPRIETLGGLDAELSDSGGNLSAGQRQLLSVARVLAADPPIVILDEATANIDSVTEQAVQQAMDEVFAGRTVVVVAHRLSTIESADRIAVLHQGKLVELGNHQDLMTLGGRYATLVARGVLLSAEPRQSDGAHLQPT